MQPEYHASTGVDISNGSKVIAFSNVGFQKFKMVAKMTEFFDVVW
jgi:hypothetical protein